MAEEQLKLFDTCGVLQQRFDRAFFRSLPTCPGVYLMLDTRGRVIYVGKAKSLRQRIGSYRYANERCSRKTARLIAHIAHIRWQTCASEEAALLEENRLLRELRPPFNRVNTWPKASRFVRIAVDANTVELSLVAEPTHECYGAFKGASRENFGSLLRFLCAGETSYATLPRRLLVGRAPIAYGFPMEQTQGWLEDLRAFLRGEPAGLLKPPPTAVTADNCHFHAAFREADALAIEHFFRIGPQRNRVIRERFGTSELIAHHELDDLIVRHRHSNHSSALTPASS